MRSSAVPEDGCHAKALYWHLKMHVLRSSAVPEDGCHDRPGSDRGRHGLVAILSRPGGRLPPHHGHHHQLRHLVAILSRPGGRLPRRESTRGRAPAGRCDPQPSRRTAATLISVGQAIHHAGCDPQPSRRTAATLDGPVIADIDAELRSSAVPEDGCHPTRHTAAVGGKGCDPQPSRRTAATSSLACCRYRPVRLRSSAVPEDGCHPYGARNPYPMGHGCDPQPSRRTAATPRGGVGTPLEGCGCDPQPSRRTAATGRKDQRVGGVGHVAILSRPGGRLPRAAPDRLPRPRAGCDPQPSRRTAATGPRFPPKGHHEQVAILSRPGGRLPLDTFGGIDILVKWLRSSAVPEDGCHRDARLGHDYPRHVAILSRPGGRLPRRRCDRPSLAETVAILSRPGGRLPPPIIWMPPSPEMGLRSSAVPEDGCHPDVDVPGACPCGVAILSRPGGRLPPCRCCRRLRQRRRCDPQPSRRTAATPRGAWRGGGRPGVAILSRPGGRLPPRQRT